MAGHELERRLEHRSRTDEELEADFRRAREVHVNHTHAGDSDACRCDLVAVEACTDMVVVTATTDVDGLPLSVAPPSRTPITGAVWKAPNPEGNDHD